MIFRFFGKMAYRLGGPILFPFVLKDSKRARTLVINEDKVLLIRSLVSSQRWALPGGGVKKSESDAQAAARELKEETRLVVSSDELIPLGEEDATSLGTGFKKVYFYTEIQPENISIKKAVDIIELDWFKMENLPEPLHEEVDFALSEYRDKNHNK